MTNNESLSTREALFARGTIWITGTSVWTGNDRLSADDLGKEANEIPDIFKLGNKSLIPIETKNKLQRPRQQLAGLMSRVGKPFLGIRSAYFVPDKNLLLAKEGVEAIRVRMQAIVDDLIEHLPAIKQEMIEQYPILADAQWPTAKHIRRQFDIKVSVFQIAEANIHDADPEEIIAAKQQFAAELRADFEEMKNSLLAEGHKAIIEICNEIADQIQKGGAKITDATIRKPRKIIEDYLNVAEIFDAAEIKAEVLRLREIVDNVETKTLRRNWRAADAFGDAMRELGNTIGELSGVNKKGGIKRVVKIRDNESPGSVADAA